MLLLVLPVRSPLIAAFLQRAPQHQGAVFRQLVRLVQLGALGEQEWLFHRLAEIVEKEASVFVSQKFEKGKSGQRV